LRPARNFTPAQVRYDWQKPGLGRRPVAARLHQKRYAHTSTHGNAGDLFLRHHDQTVDVSVNFPRGLITEWYPQATQIGPGNRSRLSIVANLDRFAHKIGVKPAFTFASLLSSPGAKRKPRPVGRIESWPNEAQSRRCAPFDQSAATTSPLAIRMPTTCESIQGSRLIPCPSTKSSFFIVVWKFPHPLTVTMNSSDAVTIANTSRSLSSTCTCWGCKIARKIIYIDRLSAGEHRTIQIDLRTASRRSKNSLRNS